MKPSPWDNATAPTLADIETLAAAAWERLPAEFRAKATDILIRVEDFATDEVLDSLGIESPFDLLGLFHGVSLNHQSVMDLPRQPNMVFLYRRAILEVGVRQVERSAEYLLNPRPPLGGHPWSFDPISTRSQAFAIAHSRFTVRGEMSIA